MFLYSFTSSLLLSQVVSRFCRIGSPVLGLGYRPKVRVEKVKHQVERTRSDWYVNTLLSWTV